MKELNKKVFLTIFLILSIFIGSSFVAYNVLTYNDELFGVKRNLTFVDEKNNGRPEPKEFEPRNDDLDNMKIMDYEIYTIILKDSNIDKIINHSSNPDIDNLEDIVSDILDHKQGLKIGNLYFSKYSYNYKNNSIVIINTESINTKLRLTLVYSIIIFFIMEVVIYFVSINLTKWITKPAQEAFDKQKDFIADASHELKTPLAVIMASSDELKSDKKNNKYVENIKYESDRMNKLITSLLDLSKIDNALVINKKDENISKIVEKTCLTFESIAFEKGILINTDIDNNIIFNCNKDEMERLIAIILDNAIKHSYDNTSINVKLNKIKNKIMIDIINSGDPINKGDEEKIFERFYRSDKSRKRNDNRYGLGLAIAKSIVTKHNGVISASSNDGKTDFKIIFKI